MFDCETEIRTDNWNMNTRDKKIHSVQEIFIFFFDVK